MVKKDNMTSNNFKKPEELPHITAQEFCDNMDGILEKVSKEKVGYVITQKEKSDIVLCPMEWVDVRYDEDFQLILLSAVRYSLHRDTYMPSVTVEFIRRNMRTLSDKTIALLIKDIEREIEQGPLFGEIPQKELWESLQAVLAIEQLRRENK